MEVNLKTRHFKHMENIFRFSLYQFCQISQQNHHDDALYRWLLSLGCLRESVVSYNFLTK